MIFHEREAATVILPLEIAKSKGFEYTFPSKLITLNIHSSLEAVGFMYGLKLGRPLLLENFGQRKLFLFESRKNGLILTKVLSLSGPP